MHEISDIFSDDQLSTFYDLYLSVVREKEEKSNTYKKRILDNKSCSSVIKSIFDQENLANVQYDQIDTALIVDSIHGYTRWAIFKKYDKDVFITSLKDIARRYNIYKLIYNNKLNVIKFNIRDLIISEKDAENHTNISFNVGDFQICLENSNGYAFKDIPNFSRTSLFTVSAIPTGSNQPREIRRPGDICYHPHIYAGSVCQGSYKITEQAYRDYEQIDIISYIYNICEVLTHYNPSSIHHPGADISHWVGAKCSACYMYISEHQGKVSCKKTGVVIHEECAVLIDNDYYAPIVVKTCNNCNKETINYISTGPRVFVCKKCTSDT